MRTACGVAVAEACGVIHWRSVTGASSEEWRKHVDRRLASRMFWFWDCRHGGGEYGGGYSTYVSERQEDVTCLMCLATR